MCAKHTARKAGTRAGCSPEPFHHNFIIGGEGMKVVVISKSTFQVVEYNNVTSIAYDASTLLYTFTLSGGSTQTASANLYNVQIVW